MVMKIKNFEADDLRPKTVPDGTSLEEKINTFMAPMDPKNVLDVLTNSTASGKYGSAEKHFGTVVYKE